MRKDVVQANAGRALLGLCALIAVLALAAAPAAAQVASIAITPMNFSTGSWLNGNNFVFGANFGQNNVYAVCAILNQSPTYAFNGSDTGVSCGAGETSWTQGNLSLTPDGVGPQYFHALGFNSSGQAGSQQDAGPFGYDYEQPAGSNFATLTSTGGLLSEGGVNFLSDVSAQTSVQESTSGLAVSTFSVSFPGDGYSFDGATAGFGVMYSTNAGKSWIDDSAVTQAGVSAETLPTDIKAMAVYGDEIYAGDANGHVYVSANGTSWTDANSGNPVSTAAIAAMAVFNGELYAADASGFVYASSNGSLWPLAGDGVTVGSDISSLAVFNGALWAGDAKTCHIYASANGTSWQDSNNGASFTATTCNSVKMAVFSNKLYASVSFEDYSDNISVSTGVDAWSASPIYACNGGGCASVPAMVAFNGDLYTGGDHGSVGVSGNGASWTWTGEFDIRLGAFAGMAALNGKLYIEGYENIYGIVPGQALTAANIDQDIIPSGQQAITPYGLTTLAAFNGALYAGDSKGHIYQIEPDAAALAGGDGTTAAQTLSATGLTLTQSTNTATCGGVFGCDATNQVAFTASDLAGNVKTLGPYAVVVDYVVGAAISTPTYPAGDVNVQPNFVWEGPSTATLAGIESPEYVLQVSKGDPTFATTVVNVSMPAVINSSAAFGGGAYAPSYSFLNGAVYYWRVAMENGLLGDQGPWSGTAIFTMDLSAPAASNFATLDSTGGAVSEGGLNSLASGVTAQMTIQDSGTGLAVSTGALAFYGDGHDWSSATSGYGVMYSTDAGNSWIDGSALTVANTGGNDLEAFAAFNGELYAGDGYNGHVYVSPNGLSWGDSNGGSPVGNGIAALAVFGGELYAGGSSGYVYANSGSSWNGGVLVGSYIQSLAVFNGELYAGDGNGHVYVSANGSSWSDSDGGFAVGTSTIEALAVFRGQLYAASANGYVYVSSGTGSWSAGVVVGQSGYPIRALAVYDGDLYAGGTSGHGSILNSANGTTWGTVSGAANNVSSLTAFNGKLYAADYGSIANDNIAVYAPNASFSAVFTFTGGFPKTVGAMTVFNGDLYAGEGYGEGGNYGGSVYQLAPDTATLSGTDGATGNETLTASGLNLAQSTNAAVCGGAYPCGATNQVMFTASDLSGNALRAGPYAILVDTITGVAVSTPVYPAGDIAVQPNFVWEGPSIGDIAAITNPSYVLEVSKNDPSFGAGNLVVNISTPAVIASTSAAFGGGAYSPNGSYNFTDGTIYYWRVAIKNGSSGDQSPWSQTAQFTTDFDAPLASDFQSVGSTGPIVESAFNTLSSGVTVEMTIQDAGSGLAISTGVLPYIGNGSEGQNYAPGTSGYGVMYSTDAGNSWIDDSTVTYFGSAPGQVEEMGSFNGYLLAITYNGSIYDSSDGGLIWTDQGEPLGGNEGGVSAFGEFNGQLYAGMGNGYIGYSSNGTGWTVANGGTPVGSSIRSFAAFDGEFYAGDSSNGNIYATSNGVNWSTAATLGSDVYALAVYNGYLYAGCDTGLYASANGVSWSLVESPVGFDALAVFNGKLYAGNGEAIYAVTGPNSYELSHVFSLPGSEAVDLTSFGGKLYIRGSNSSIYASVNGAAWGQVAVSFSSATNLLPYDGKLIYGFYNGELAAIAAPLANTLPGSDGETSAQTLSATGLSLANSTNSVVCGGAYPCAATNQVIFTASDLAGNVAFGGPYAVLVDLYTGEAVSTPTWPTGDVNGEINNSPDFIWQGPSTATLANVAGPSYILQVSKGDPSFGAGNLVVNISTPAVIQSTGVAFAAGAYASSYDFSDDTIYYWRVATLSGSGDQSPWSEIGSFFTDFDAPAASQFESIGSTGPIDETSINTLTSNVTAQMTVQDTGTGLAVSTGALAFYGGGHDDPQTTSGWGVMYSTNAGNSWIDASAITTANGGEPVGTDIRSFAVFDDNLYAGDANGDIYESANGNSWSGTPVGGGGINALAVFNGKLYTGGNTGYVYESANGTSWNAANGGAKVGSNIQALAAFNGKLYAGDVSNGDIYVSADGNTWSTTNGGAPVGTMIHALAAFNGRLYEGDYNGDIYASADGNSWTMVASGVDVESLAVFNGRIYAGNYNGRVYSSANGNTWSSLVQVSTSTNLPLYALTAFNGKLYAGNSVGDIYASANGNNWEAINGGAPVGYDIYSLADFNGKLYAGDYSDGDVYQISPVTATITGLNGATGAETLTASGLNLANSANTTTCGGTSPCLATNQVMFTASDLAGNQVAAGPYAIIVDAFTGAAISTPTWPAGDVNGEINNSPDFVWQGPSTATLAGVGNGNASYLLQVSANDPTFASTVINISTPAVVASTSVAFPNGAYAPTYAFANNTVYYWRVAVQNNEAGDQSPWSQTQSFTTDFTPPAASQFESISSTGAIAESAYNSLSSDVTAQMTVQDAGTGLAVSTGALAFYGDGHDWQNGTSGYGVMYSTNAGNNWIDASTITISNGGDSLGEKITAMAVFNGKLYAGGNVNGEVYVSANGSSWGESDALASGGQTVRAFAAFNGKLYAGLTNGAVWAWNGSSWEQSNGGNAVGQEIYALSAFNGQLYAGDGTDGKVYVSADGNTWSTANGGAAVGAGIFSLTVFDGKLYAGGTNGLGGYIYVSQNGNSWSAVNGGVSIGANITPLAAFNGELYAGSETGYVYASENGNTWSAVNGGNAVGQKAQSFAAFNGKLYMGDSGNGKVYVSVNGENWSAINDGNPVGESIYALSAFNGQLYAGDYNSDDVYEISPVTATLSGINGATGAQTLTAAGLNLVDSTSSVVCGGVTPCGATDQVMFTASDLAGNQVAAGPYAILVDTSIGAAVSTPTWPSGDVNSEINNQPDFVWQGPSTTTLAGIPDPSYLLQVSQNDPTFGTTVINISTPAVVASTFVAFAGGAYAPTYAFANNTIYYWRVAMQNGLTNDQSPWSETQSFTTDFTSPAASGFVTIGSTGPIGESVYNTLSSDVTAQMTVQDAGTGLAISTGALAFYGDGHDWPQTTSGWGVMYSTNAGQSWIDDSTVTTHALSYGITSVANFNGELYFGTNDGYIYSSANGTSWSAPITVAGGRNIYALAVFNGQLYASVSGAYVFASPNGTTWTSTDGGAEACSSGDNTLAVFNGKLYTGGGADVCVSADGNTWSVTNGGNAIGSGINIESLAVFNGKLYAGDGAHGYVYVSEDGNTWSAANGGSAVGDEIYQLAVFDGKLYAGDFGDGKVYASANGSAWSAANGGASLDGRIQALSAFDGELYAGMNTGYVYVSANGNTWSTTNGGATVGINIPALASFDGQLYAGDYFGDAVYEISPVTATITGLNGATAAETLTATGLTLAGSTNSEVCGGNPSCGATNQVMFTASDLAGNVVAAGPYAVLVDTTIGAAVSTPTWPSGDVDFTQPNFVWQGASTGTLSAIPDPLYVLQVSNGDPNFGASNLVINVSTPAVLASTGVAFGSGAYAPSSPLPDGPLYYWRTAVQNGLSGNQGRWSETASFTTDVTPPVASDFGTVGSTGGLLGESQISGLSQDVTAQMTVQDTGVGLALSTGAIAFYGDGHDWQSGTSGWGVMYSTDAGNSWVDDSTITVSNGGSPVGEKIYALAAFNGKLWAGDFGNGRIYASADGNSWTTANGGAAVGQNIHALAAFNGMLYAGDSDNGRIYASADGNSWTTANGGAAVGVGILALSVFDGKLYAGDYGTGKIYVSADGNTWSTTNGGAAVGGHLYALAVFNGKLYAGDSSNGKIYASEDGNSWAAANGGAAVGSSIFALAAFNGKLYAGDYGNGKIYESADGNSWSTANGGAAVGTQIVALAAFDGKLYAGDGANGRIYVSADGNSWMAINGRAAVGADAQSLAGFNGKLYAGDGSNGDVYQLTPAAASLTGVDGTTGAQTLAASGLDLANSTNSTTCGGVYPCGATNQIMFTASDLAGNQVKAGPYAMIVDAYIGAAASTPTWPTGDINVQPNFAWQGASTATLSAITNPTYVLEVSKGDPTFGAGNIVIDISTPAVVASTSVAFGGGAYASIYTLNDDTAYYWRTAVEDALGTQGPWSQTASFFTDFNAPVASDFETAGSTGGFLSESQITGVSQDVTAQMTIQDTGAGLAVSTGPLAFYGDGHDWPGTTSGFGVMYSTDAGQSWIDGSTVSAVNGGAPLQAGDSIRSLAEFNGKFFAATSGDYIYSSVNGYSAWSAASPNFGFLPQAMAVFNGRLYAAGVGGGIAWSSNGSSWNIGAIVGAGNLLSLAVFDGKLYAGSQAGEVYASADGETWSAANGGNPVGGNIDALTSFNGKLYAGDASNGDIYSSEDGNSWGSGTAVGAVIHALAAFNGKLYAGDYGTNEVYVSANGSSWASFQSAGFNVITLAAFNGQLYAGGNSVNLAVSNGGAFVPVPVAASGDTINALASFNGQLYAGGEDSGDVYELAPLSVSLTGADGTTSAQTLSVSELGLVNSTNTAVCDGNPSCGATNQVMFTASDLAGNQVSAGPYAIIVDAAIGEAASTPTWPSGDIDMQQPNFVWQGPSTAALAGISEPSYQLEVSKNDPSFSAGNLVINTSTPAVIASTAAPFAAGAEAYAQLGYGFLDDTTYYWRVSVLNGSLGDESAWSKTESFFTDFDAPTSSGFASLMPSGELLGESGLNALGEGVTVQMTIEDTGSGLANSTAAFSFYGDGHDYPGAASGFSVYYSTDAGASWIDDSSTAAATSGGASVNALAAFNGQLYAASYAANRIYSSASGASWNAVTGPVSQPDALAVFKGELYAGGSGVIAASANGGSFNSVDTSVGDITSLQAFNGQLYAADYANGEIWATANGSSWFSAASLPGPQALAVFDGELYAATVDGLYASQNGISWSAIASLPVHAYALAVYDGELYAASGTSVYSSSNGLTWTQTSLASLGASNVRSLCVSGGQLYAGDVSVGMIFTSAGGTSWTALGGGAPVGENISALTGFDGRLYAGDGGDGNVYQLTPVQASLSGANGATGTQTLSGLGLDFVTSINAFTCGGVSPCGATNQVMFAAQDLAGNVHVSGPWAVDATTTPTILANFESVAPGTAQQGLPVALEYVSLAAAYGDAPWSSLVVNGIGTNLPSDVDSVSVWRDAAGTGIFNPATDVEISNANQNFSAGAATVSFSAAENLTTTPRGYFVVYQVDPVALPGDTLRAQISSAAAFDFSGQNWAINATPGLPATSSQTVIGVSVSTLTLTPESIAPGAAAPGQTDVAVLRVTGQTQGGTAQLTSLTFNLLGTAPSNAVATISLYRDNAGTGIFNSSDSLVSSGLDDFTDGVATVDFTSSAASATVGDNPTVFFAVLNLSPGAPIGDTLGLQLATTAQVGVADPADTILFSTMPFESDVFPIENANTLSFSPMSLTPSQMTQGQEYAVMEATLTVNNGQMTISQISVREAGDGGDADVSEVKVYQAPNPPEAFNPVTFNLLGSAEYTSGVANITLNQTLTAPTTYVYYISYVVSPTAQAGDTLAAKISGAASISITNPIGIVAGTFPFTTSTGTVVATQTGLLVSGADEAPGDLTQGTTAVQMLNLSMDTTQYALALEGLTVQELGTAGSADVTALRLYEDNVGNGVLNVSADVQVGYLSAPFQNGVAFLSLSDPLSISQTKIGLILAVDVSPTANYTATLGLGISSYTSVSVSAPNFVVNQNFPIDSSVVPILKQPDTLYVLPQNLASSSGVIQGVETPFMQITAWASPTFSVWQTMNLTLEGTLPSAQISAIKVYANTSGGSSWSGSDLLIGSTTVNSGFADVVFSSAQTVNVSSSVYFVTLTPALSATIGDTAGLALPGSSALSVLAPDSISGNNMPFATVLSPVLDGRTPTTPVVTFPGGLYNGSYDSLSFVWTSTVVFGSITSASYAIGTTPGGVDIRAFTPIIPVSSNDYTATGFFLNSGTSYYVSVEVGSSLGFNSLIGESVGQLVDTTIPGVPEPLSILSGEGGVLASWPAASAGPSGIRGYLLQYMNLDSPVWYNARTGAELGTGGAGGDEESNEVQAQAVLAMELPQDVDVSTPSLAFPPESVENLPDGTYLFEVQSISGAGLTSASSPLVRALIGAAPSSDFEGLSSYPNPFDSRSGQATIVYGLTQNENVTIKIFDVFGGLVRSLSFSAGATGGQVGTNNVNWDGTDSSGRKVSKGIYIAVFHSGNGKATYKIGVIH